MQRLRASLLLTSALIVWFCCPLEVDGGVKGHAFLTNFVGGNPPTATIEYRTNGQFVIFKNGTQSNPGTYAEFGGGVSFFLGSRSFNTPQSGTETFSGICLGSSFYFGTYSNSLGSRFPIFGFATGPAPRAPRPGSARDGAAAAQ